MTTLQIRIDEDLREKAAAVCRGMGLDISTAVRMFLVRLAADGQFPFRPRCQAPFSPKNDDGESSEEDSRMA